ncbi:MAG TPA: acyl carrier protein [Micromonosporaceae bacterium]
MSPDRLIAEVVADLLDVDADELSAATVLNSIHGWDSVNALRVLVYLERHLGVSLDYERFADATTLGDLARVVASVTRSEEAVR